MPDRSVDSPRTFFRSWPERVGLPASLLQGMNAVVGLFGIHGLPAFGTAMLASMSGSTRAALKMREFEGAVEEALRDLGFRMDLGGLDMEPAAQDALAERVSILQSTLSAGQIDQMGVLFEDYLRTTEAERLEVIRRAVRAVVKDAVDEGTRRTIISRLPMLSMAHLRELQRMKDRPERVRGRPGQRNREPAALHVVLLTIGFIREGAPEAPDSATVAAVRLPGEAELRVTSLGLAALRLLGPIELGG